MKNFNLGALAILLLLSVNEGSQAKNLLDFFGKDLPEIEDNQKNELKPQSYSVIGAYSLIPHGRTKFQPSSAKMSKPESQYLDDIFYISDLIVAEKVDLQIKHRQGKKIDLHNYTVLIHSLNDLDVPDRLEEIRDLILESALDQRLYFIELQESGKKFNSGDKLVQSSSHKLRKAYSILMSKYPKENKHNKKAFFDHLCAMDFI